jgi:cytochrome b
MSKEKTKVILQTCITLASAALGLVAALAWNDAIKAAMKEILGEGESVGALFVYAIVATVLAVVVVLVLANAAAKVGGEAAISREAEG